MTDTQTHMAPVVDDPTAVASDAVLTRQTPELAWSQTDDFAEAATDRYSWPSTLTRAGLLTVSAAAVAGAIAAGGLVWMATPRAAHVAPAPHTHVLPHVAAPAGAPAEPTQAAPAPAPLSLPDVQRERPPAPEAAPPTPNAAFAAAMKADGITAPDDDWPVIIYNAHRVCWTLAHGYTRAEALAEIKANTPNLTDTAVNDYVGNAVAFYCPEYAGQ